MLGTQIGHYRLTRLLGQGGMGSVYAADDLRLGRQVALKWLSDAMAADAGQVLRFRREAQLLAAVNHPNVITVHSVEEAEGRPFFTMELVDGESLEKSVRPGGLPLDRLLDIGLTLAEGLGAAHAMGIVHRDFKPANVMVGSDGRLKIVDFGIAKPDREKTGLATLTDAGFVLGTPSYMAPEQLTGDALDARVDVFAFGVVLYELATGARPFVASSNAAMATAILRDPPPRPRQLRGDIPERLEALLDACLQKDRSRRMASAGAIAAELRAIRAAITGVQAVASAPGIGSLAVLPLQELGGGGEDLLGDGITEALIANLARSSGLKVISRSSVMRFRSSTESPKAIAGQLGVDGLVTGSVRRSGNRIRISVELIEAATERVVWAERFDRELEDVLRLEDEISRAIANEVQAHVGSSPAPPATPRQVVPDVYLLDLKGQRLMESRTEAGFRGALVCFEQALDIDPTYAPSFLGIARAFIMLANYGIVAQAQSQPRAQAAIDRAVVLGADAVDVHELRALMLWQFNFDWRSADAEYRRALALSPNKARLWYWLGLMLAVSGRFDDALEALARSESLDPLSPVIPASRGWVLYFSRRYPESISALRSVLVVNPDLAPAHWFLGMALCSTGDLANSIAAFERSLALTGRISRLLGYLGHSLGRAGRVEEATALLAELDARAREAYLPAYFLALVHAGLGNTEAALSALERAWQERDCMLRDLLVDGSFDALREQPRFRALIAALGFPGQAGVAGWDEDATRPMMNFAPPA